MANKPRLVSGDTPTGKLHLGALGRFIRKSCRVAATIRVFFLYCRRARTHNVRTTATDIA